MLLTTILTAPRPNGIEYLSQTLAAIQQQTEPVVFEDAQQKGNRAMLHQILHYFASRRDYTRLLYLEDDIIPCQNLISYAKAVEIKNRWPFLSLFDARIADQRIQRLEMNAESFFYTQALIIPIETAQKLLTVDWAGRTSLPGGNGCSRHLRNSITQLGFQTYGLQTPNPIKHIGEVSAILQKTSQAKTSRNFAGETFNAELLFQHSS